MLKNESLITNAHVVDCFRNLMTKMSRKVTSLPLIYSHVAGKLHSITEIQKWVPLRAPFGQDQNQLQHFPRF